MNVVLIAIDGRYRGYNAEKPDLQEYRRSTDGSYEFIEEEAHKHIPRVVNTATPVTMDEREKRQRYVDLSVTLGCDFIIIIDSDEWFEVLDWSKLFEELEDIKKYEWRVAQGSICSICCMDIGEKQEQPQYRPRLWCDPSRIKYGDRHWQFVTVTKEGKERKPFRIRQIPPYIIQIYHNPYDCRSVERLEKQREYESNLESLESGK